MDLCQLEDAIHLGATVSVGVLQGDRVEFYDLRVDPGAQRNLGPDHPEAERHAAYIAASSMAPSVGKPAESELPGRVEIDSDTRQQLKQLGYLPSDD